MADGRGQGVYMLHCKTRSRSWKGVAVLGALPHFVPSADAFPTVLHYSICTPCPLTLSLPLSAIGGGGAVGSVHAVGDGSIGTEQVFVGRWADCVGICHFQTVGSASALSERTSRSEAVNLVSATHFHERERVWK